MTELVRRPTRLALVGIAGLALFAAVADARPAPTTATTQTLTVTLANEAVADGLPPLGRVTSTPEGIDCPTICSATFAAGTNVQLRATATTGYEPASWSGVEDPAACDGQTACALTLSAASPSAVTVSFRPAAELQLATAGPGTLTIAPTQPGLNATCNVDAQQSFDLEACDQRFRTGTRVTLTAAADPGRRFAGWSDYGCSDRSLRCTLTLGAGVRYLTARFTPVTLSLTGDAFGAVVVQPGGTCPPTCSFTYSNGAVVTLRREHPAAGLFWVGGCDNNREGLLDAPTCRIRLAGDELVGAGFDNVGSIPPPLGSGIAVTLAGNRRGSVTGKVVNGTKTLSCGRACTITGLMRYEQVRLTATASKGNRFVRWSDGSAVRTRTFAVARVNRISATFARRASRRR